MLREELAGFFLVGGTALALQMGHRVSVDLDLFTLTDFDQEELIYRLSDEFNLQIESISPSILITQKQQCKSRFCTI